MNRHESPIGIRVPQAGVLHEPNAEQPTYDDAAGHLRNTFKRTHRWEKVLRDQDEPLGRQGVAAGQRCCSAPCPTTWSCTASRWPATSRSGHEDADCCSTDRTPRPTRSSRRCGRSGGRRVRLPVPVPGHARGQTRGLLAPAAGRLPRRGRRGRRAAGRAARLPDGLRRRQAATGPRRRAVAAHAAATGAYWRRWPAKTTPASARCRRKSATSAS